MSSARAVASARGRSRARRAASTAPVRATPRTRPRSSSTTASASATTCEHLARADEREPRRRAEPLRPHPVLRADSAPSAPATSSPLRSARSRGRYLDHLAREIELLAERLPRRRSLAQMQWGGGTPTYLSPAELEATSRRDRAPLRLSRRAPSWRSRSTRASPRREQLETLARLGFNRLSMGVQDFTPAVQAAIGRRPDLRGDARAGRRRRASSASASGINFDLVYGLPLQDEESFERKPRPPGRAAARPRGDLLLRLRALGQAAPAPDRRRDAARRRGQARALPRRAGAPARRGLRGDRHRPLRAARRRARPRRARAPPRPQLHGLHRRIPPSRRSRSASPASARSKAPTSRTSAGWPTYYAALDARPLPIQRGYLLDDDDRLRQLRHPPADVQLRGRQGRDRASVRGRLRPLLRGAARPAGRGSRGEPRQPRGRRGPHAAR